jgi:hypothetical protein
MLQARNSDAEKSWTAKNWTADRRLANESGVSAIVTMGDAEESEISRPMTSV